MRLVLIALAAALLHLSLPAAAQSPTGQSDGRITSDEMIAGVISEIERRTIGRYYNGDRYEEYEEESGHGKAKKGNKGKNKGKDQGKSGDVATDRLLGAIISATERALIGDYVQKAKASGQGLPPGLAKRQHLPPGLQKHIDRTGRLPPGQEKRRLPGDLRARLPIRSGQDFAWSATTSCSSRSRPTSSSTSCRAC